MSRELEDRLVSFAWDPYGFVMWAFPWGEPGELAQYHGPEEWQCDILQTIHDELSFDKALRIAVASGRGIGKSALVSWLILWALSTFVDTRGVVTANTESQLVTKTWAELAKWYRLFIGRDLFKMTATTVYSVDPQHPDWRIDRVAWSENNPAAFQGLHNQGKRFLYLFDEASHIADVIVDAADTSFTDANTQKLFFMFGNPNKNRGRFADCWGRFAKRWITRNIDSRSVSIADQNEIAELIEAWGEDHDIVRIMVKGQFPRVDTESFISHDLAMGAATRDVTQSTGPVLLGVDIGRFGDDPSVIYPRQGRDGKSRPIEVYFNLDTMQMALRVIQAINRHGAAYAFVDEGGVGGGVVDRLRELRAPVIAVDFGSKPDGVNEDRGIKYANKRAEIWGALKDWLSYGAIHERVKGLEVTLVDELTAPNYGLNIREEILLEAKKEMRRRGVPSPNIADALATTFAFPALDLDFSGVMNSITPIYVPDYNPYSKEMMAI